VKINKVSGTQKHAGTAPVVSHAVFSILKISIIASNALLFAPYTFALEKSVKKWNYYRPADSLSAVFAVISRVGG
jgi:hypothetical protein